MPRDGHAVNFVLCAGQDSSTFEGGIPHSVVDRTKCNSFISNVPLVEPQSDAAFSVTTGSKTTSSENVQFMDNNPAFNYIVSSSDDPTRGIADMGDATLGEFLSRPVLIKEYAWTPGLTFFEQFNPWQLFMDNVRNINRVCNYNLFRSRLCVRILINGNGFYYGRMIASYNPLPDSDQTSVWPYRLAGGGALDADVIMASQKPHIYINPTECQGGDLCVPFVHYQNALRVPDSQWSEMGQVTMIPLTDLKNANGAVDPISISVFAYVEDANMSIPTESDPITVQPQSDEYGSSPVSAPASAVARAAGALTSVPVIGPFARATQIAAGAVSGIAKLFGFSRPAVLTPIQVYKPEYVGGLANTNTPDGTNKLSLDAKQELTVDPMVVGVGAEDEMQLVSLAKRESYYTSFAWDPVGQPASGPGYMLFRTQVHPWINQVVNPGSTLPNVQDTEEFHFLPCGLAVMPFEAWGGSMEFRFQVVCSNFHRGRLRIVWDPSNLADIANGGYNTAYNRIVDIADMKDFTFKVGWGKEYSFLPNHDPFERYTSNLGNTPPVPTFEPNPLSYNINTVRGNGILSVYVVNDLTVPNTNPGVNNSIEINVFASMCDDARFAQPVDLSKRSISYLRPYNAEGERLPPPPVVDPQAEAMQEQEMAPVSQGVDTTLASEQPTDDHLMAVFYGEQVNSIRELIKRYSYHHTTYSNVEQTDLRVKMPDFPYYPGYNPDGEATATTGDFSGTKLSLCNNSFLNLFSPAFVAYRGGIRWKHQAMTYNTVSSANQTDTPDMFSVDRASGVVTNPSTLNLEYSPTERYIGYNFFAPGTIETTRSSLLGLSSFTNGGFTTPTRLNPVCEVELPFYNNRRFMSARRLNNLDTRTITDECPPVHNVHIVGRTAGINNYVAAAEDFSLAFFVGVPPIYNFGASGYYPLPDVS